MKVENNCLAQLLDINSPDLLAIKNQRLRPKIKCAIFINGIVFVILSNFWHTMDNYYELC